MITGPMKILIIITSGLGREGITSSTLEILKEMGTRGLCIHIADVLGADPEVIKDFEDAGYKVISFPNRKKKLFAYRRALKKVLLAEKYNAVHVCGSSSLMAIELGLAKRCGIKERIAHSRNTTNNHKFLDKVLRRHFYNCYTYAMACGIEAGAFLFGNNPFMLFHNGKDFKKYVYSEELREQVRQKYNFQNSYVIGFVGRISQQKNPMFMVDILSEALKMRHDCKLLVVGDGVMRQEFIDYATERGVMQNILLTGSVNNANEIIHAMDVAILPSLHEGLPNVVVEWQLSGLNCFVSDKVTDECAPCDFVKFLPIDKGAKLWAEGICNVKDSRTRVERSEYACKQLREEGFDLNEAAQRLRQLYFYYI